ncbi:hypothetical protein BRD00_08375 [Halobacteriales archaeon QS_8_69_26]|nr:MAG: hypothetical protein BRD00_08375 [Halobacteriales archaeon QS_8_69_26]
MGIGRSVPANDPVASVSPFYKYPRSTSIPVHNAGDMKRRQFIGSVALGALGATAGCINLAGDGGDEPTPAPGSGAGPENFDMELCSEYEDAVYRISGPDLERQDEQDRVRIVFTLDYIGPNEDAFSVTPTINVILFDADGNEVGSLGKSETFSPSKTEELEYFYSDEGWGQVVDVGFDIIHQRSDEDAGCLADEDAT